jgi:hypothetical protein
MEWNKHIKKFEKYDDPEDDFDFDFASELSPKQYGKYNDDEPDDEMKAAFEHLASTIRQMIRNAGVKNYTVSVHDKDFVMEFIMEQEKKFSSFVALIGLMKKIHQDVLIQYEPAIDLWYTKDKRPLLTIDFYYREGGSESKLNYTDDFPF